MNVKITLKTMWLTICSSQSNFNHKMLCLNIFLVYLSKRGVSLPFFLASNSNYG